MCIATLHQSCRACRHRWYKLNVSCAPTVDFSNCTSRVQIHGWETRENDCILCNDDDSFNDLDQTQYVLFPEDRFQNSRGNGVIEDLASDLVDEHDPCDDDDEDDAGLEMTRGRSRLRRCEQRPQDELLSPEPDPPFNPHTWLVRSRSTSRFSTLRSSSQDSFNDGGVSDREQKWSTANQRLNGDLEDYVFRESSVGDGGFGSKLTKISSLTDTFKAIGQKSTGLVSLRRIKSEKMSLGFLKKL